jgi:hypothetical protein
VQKEQSAERGDGGRCIPDNITQGVTVIGIAGETLSCATNWPPEARAVAVTIGTLTTNS